MAEATTTVPMPACFISGSDRCRMPGRLARGGPLYQETIPEHAATRLSAMTRMRAGRSQSPSPPAGLRRPARTSTPELPRPLRCSQVHWPSLPLRERRLDRRPQHHTSSDPCSAASVRALRPTQARPTTQPRRPHREAGFPSAASRMRWERPKMSLRGASECHGPLAAANQVSSPRPGRVEGLSVLDCRLSA